MQAGLAHATLGVSQALPIRTVTYLLPLHRTVRTQLYQLEAYTIRYILRI